MTIFELIEIILCSIFDVSNCTIQISLISYHVIIGTIYECRSHDIYIFGKKKIMKVVFFRENNFPDNDSVHVAFFSREISAM